MVQSTSTDEFRPDRASWAFFFDLDGTLAPLVQRPELAQVPESTKTLLAQLHEGANGAVAIISGRPLTALDELLYPLVLPAAAEHGAIVRDAAGNRSTLGSEAGQVPGLANWLDQQLAEREGILVERKTFGVAVHFRLAPHAATEISELMTRAAGRFPQFELMAGKMVVEAKLPSVDKGRALAYLMRGEPFAGRRPLMVGDDTTDEAAFHEANQQGGCSMKIGGGDSCATLRLQDPAALAAWLAGI